MSDTKVVSFLGLSADHEHLIVEYLRSAKSKRTQSLKAIDSTFEELKESRLVEDTFTLDEVSEMLGGLCGVMKADVGEDLINSSHTNAQLLRHLLQQAEKWHLTMQADISEMDNRELLNEIAQFEERELSFSPKQSFSSQGRKQLEPMNTGGGDKLLNMEINRLEKENRKLRERIQGLESKVSTALSEKDQLKSDLAAAKQVSGESVTASSSGGEVAELQARIEKLQTQLSDTSTHSGTASQEELAKTSQELLRVNAELKTTKQELERKFSETTQYENMRKMLETKNKTIKDLRTRLNKYEPGGK